MVYHRKYPKIRFDTEQVFYNNLLHGGTMPNNQIPILVSEEVIRSVFTLLTALLIEVMRVIISDIKK